MARGKRLEVDQKAAPITWEEVERMWLQALPGGPFLFPETYERIAKTLTFHLGHGAQDYIRPRKTVPLRDQIKRSRAALFDYLQPIREAMGSFSPTSGTGPGIGTGKAWKGRSATDISLVSGDTWLLGLPAADYRRLTDALEALDAGLPVLDRLSTSSAPARSPVWDMAAQIAWGVARDALQTIGETAEMAESSKAVRFAALAAQRMGFPRATASAISKRLIKFSKK